jgi:hypothetical protein
MNTDKIYYYLCVAGLLVVFFSVPCFAQSSSVSFQSDVSGWADHLFDGIVRLFSVVFGIWCACYVVKTVIRAFLRVK